MLAVPVEDAGYQKRKHASADGCLLAHLSCRHEWLGRFWNSMAERRDWRRTQGRPRHPRIFRMDSGEWIRRASASVLDKRFSGCKPRPELGLNTLTSRSRSGLIGI